MQVITIETPSLGDRSYIVHDGSVALVIDPQRDIDRVVDAVSDAGVEITHIAETHLHNDYVSGGLSLARITGATYLHAGDEPLRFDYHAVHDGDTIQIGTGEPSRGMARLGAFDGRKHLGIHTELGWPGLARMWRDGIVDGSRKELHAHKSVAAAWTGTDPNDQGIIDGNPHFELYDPEYVLHPRTLTKFDRFVAINNAITVDLLGQINSESVFGGRIINGTGGQPEMHTAGAFSPHGRAITLLQSTAMGGAVSKIVPQMDAGSLVTIPRFYADIIITEYGVARLWGKNHRQRAEALIAIAHPDHRDALTEQARALWWP